MSPISEYPDQLTTYSSPIEELSSDNFAHAEIVGIAKMRGAQQFAANLVHNRFDHVEVEHRITDAFFKDAMLAAEGPLERSHLFLDNPRGNSVDLAFIENHGQYVLDEIRRVQTDIAQNS